MAKLFLTKAQRDCLVDFVKGINGRRKPAVLHAKYGLIGSEDLADQKKSTAMLAALQSGDWESASAHNALAGTNDLLLGICLWLDTTEGGSCARWVAMRSPFELMDWPTVVAAGKVDQLPPVALDLLF